AGVWEDEPRIDELAQRPGRRLAGVRIEDLVGLGDGALERERRIEVTAEPGDELSRRLVQTQRRDHGDREIVGQIQRPQLPAERTVVVADLDEVAAAEALE